MAHPFGEDHVQAILVEENFTILRMIEDDEQDRAGFVISHVSRPDDEINIFLVSNEQDEAAQITFEGPDEYTEDEAKQILNEVMDAFIKIIEVASIDEESGSGSASASGSESGGE
jgi:flagellar basal body-associated protein FliL